jgi:3-phenylpropionate/cinnamic acid dioxygenase small subunit
VTDDAIRSLLLHHECEQFLVHEALLLDDNRYDEWFELLTLEVEYVVPVRIVVEGDSHPSFSERAFHFKEDSASLRARIDRLKTGVAWAEVPPTRTQRFVSNVMVDGGADSEQAIVRSWLLLYLARSDPTRPEIVMARRRDRLTKLGGRWRISSRWAYLGQTMLASSLSVFL